VASAAAIDLAIRRAAKKVQRAIDDGIQHASADVGNSGNHRSKAAALLLLLSASRVMSARVQQEVRAARQQARELSSERLGIELGAASSLPAIAIAAAAIASHGLVSSHASFEDDDARASLAGDTLAMAWRGLATYAVIRAFNTSKPAARALDATRAPMTSRGERTAISELSDAYTDERDRSVSDAMKADAAFADAVSRSQLAKQWDCTGERQPCPKCWAHQGERAPFDEDFSNGDVPGQMHPSCKCIWVATT
jgi:hypothetical protein